MAVDTIARGLATQANAAVGALPVLASGTYTPTLTNSTNVASSTAFQCNYLRVGNIVIVSGRVSITVTTANSSTTLLMTVPIASAMSDANAVDCGGTAVATNINESLAILASSGKAQFTGLPTSTSTGTYWFSFMYLVN